MTLRSLSLTTLFAASLFAASADAHDPSLHEQASAPKAKPGTCEELADSQRFSAEQADKALKTQCEADAEKAQETKVKDQRD